MQRTSDALYAPVILWGAQLPILGMLMIPKTCAYLGIAFITYRELCRRQPAPTPQFVGTAAQRF